MAGVTKISPALKKRAAQIKLLLMDGPMSDGSVTLLSQTDGTALEIKTFDAHDGQGLTLAKTAACLQAALLVAKVPHSSAAPTK